MHLSSKKKDHDQHLLLRMLSVLAGSDSTSVHSMPKQLHLLMKASNELSYECPACAVLRLIELVWVLAIDVLHPILEAAPADLLYHRDVPPGVGELRVEIVDN